MKALIIAITLLLAGCGPLGPFAHHSSCCPGAIEYPGGAGGLVITGSDPGVLSTDPADQ